MRYRWLIAIAVVVALGACKTSTPSKTTSKPNAEASTAEAGAKSADAAPTTFSAPELGGAPAAVRVDFFAGKFRITREDASFDTWTPDSTKVEATDSLRQQQVPRAWSPSGSLVILDGDPPVIVRLADGKEVLRFVQVEEIETAGFFPDGSGLFVAEPSGKLHVWNESEDTLTSVPTENLEAFMARQSPSFSAGFSSLSGQATVTASNQLLLGTKSGKLYWWDPENPGEVNTLVKLPGAIRDTAYSGGKVYATTEDGDFRGASKSSGVFLEWSTDLRADRVDAAPGRPTHLLLADDSSVRMVDARDGSDFWNRNLPDVNSLCGLALSDDGQTGAACLDGSVVFFEVDSGEVLSTSP